MERKGVTPLSFLLALQQEDCVLATGTEACSFQVWPTARCSDVGLFLCPWPQGRAQGHFSGSIISYSLRTARERCSCELQSLVLLSLLPEALSFILGACLLAPRASGKGRALKRFFQSQQEDLALNRARHWSGQEVGRFPAQHGLEVWTGPRPHLARGLPQSSFRLHTSQAEWWTDAKKMGLLHETQGKNMWLGLGPGLAGTSTWKMFRKQHNFFLSLFYSGTCQALALLLLLCICLIFLSHLH